MYAFLFLLTALFPSVVHAAAPARSTPYAESICTSDANVFMCEDFEGTSTAGGGDGVYCLGFNNCGSRWDNPALGDQPGGFSNPWDICFCNGGSHQLSTAALSGFSQATNNVWRISKSTSYTDIKTGVSTGTGPGTLAGFLDISNLAGGDQEWYARVQMYIHSSQNFPPDIDYKIPIWSLPRIFVDPPSAQYENGLFFHQDYFCSPTNYNDVLLMRIGSNFGSRPDANEYCPPLTPGATANNTNAVRFVKGRWYTIEAHFKLGTSTGVAEMWVDDVKAFTFTNFNTCGGGSCPDMGYIMILGYMNGGDVQQGYMEFDNLVYSHAKIGLPGAGTPTLNAPTSVTVTVP